MAFASSPRRELRFAGATKIHGLRPTAGRLLVRIEPEPAARESLILLEGHEPEPRSLRRGVVVARPADDRGASAAQVVVGDRVLFPAACGHGLRLRIDGYEHVLVREQDVLAAVEDE